jgi:23S rRNA (pseudouridine1915-N3)-methyltransferase
MKITLLFPGKTEDNYIREGLDIYIRRLKHYIPVEIKILGERGKKTGTGKLKTHGAEGILSARDNSRYVALLDEKGEKLSSGDFAGFIEKTIIQGYKELVFVTGDAYGIPRELYPTANRVLSLSEMTFTHQMVRLILIEQLYRAMTIIRGESYHHE